MIDCRSEEGKTIGLVDSLIVILQFLDGREITPEVREALLDLSQHESFKALLQAIRSAESQ